MDRCLAVGNACGALSTRSVGGTTSQPTMKEALAVVEGGSVS
jgi:sugar/nucleoside kinase (ribokinase family)